MPYICSLEALREDAATVASFYDGRREKSVIVVRHGMTLHAYEDSCPHQYLRLTYRGKQVLSTDGQRLRCSNHGAEFAVADGCAMSGPCRGVGLTRVPIRMAPDGCVIVGDE
jgi:nitrite reductase/ring-hydroxylating ferredoxin subunit